MGGSEGGNIGGFRVYPSVAVCVCSGWAGRVALPVVDILLYLLALGSVLLAGGKSTHRNSEWDISRWYFKRCKRPLPAMSPAPTPTLSTSRRLDFPSIRDTKGTPQPPTRYYPPFWLPEPTYIVHETEKKKKAAFESTPSAHAFRCPRNQTTKEPGNRTPYRNACLP